MELLERPGERAHGGAYERCCLDWDVWTLVCTNVTCAARKRSPVSECPKSCAGYVDVVHIALIAFCGACLLACTVVMRRSRRMNHTMRTPLVDTFNDEPSFDTGEEVSVKESERVREDEEPPSYVDVVVDARVRATLDTTLPALPALPTVP